MTRARNLARLVPDGSGLIPNTNLAPIAASLLTGQVADANIAAVAASKITGQVADANIAAVASSKISGQLLDGQMSSGSVLQVVYGADGTEYNTSSTSYQGGISASITPSSSSSKILATFSCRASGPLNNIDWHDFQIRRNGSLVMDYTYGEKNGTSTHDSRQHFMYLDSPASTSAVTYQLMHRAQTGSSPKNMGASQVILMEIAG